MEYVNLVMMDIISLMDHVYNVIIQNAQHAYKQLKIVY